MFLPWYGLGEQFGGVPLKLAEQFGVQLDVTFNAFESFDSADVLLFICASILAGIGLALAVGEAVQMGRVAVRVLSIVAAPVALIALIVILVKIADPPTSGDVSVKYGAYLSLFASVL